MSKSLERSAARYIRVTNRLAPRIGEHIGAMVRKGDVITDIDNRDFDSLDTETSTPGRSIERIRAVTGFIGSVAVHAPAIIMGYGRVWLAAKSFERKLAKTMSDGGDPDSLPGMDLYTKAAEIIGVDGDALMDQAFGMEGNWDE